MSQEIHILFQINKKCLAYSEWCFLKGVGELLLNVLQMFTIEESLQCSDIHCNDTNIQFLWGKHASSIVNSSTWHDIVFVIMANWITCQSVNIHTTPSFSTRCWSKWSTRWRHKTRHREQSAPWNQFLSLSTKIKTWSNVMDVGECDMWISFLELDFAKTVRPITVRQKDRLLSNRLWPDVLYIIVYQST
jgi:hypothetical protein